jgi:Holliday junction resolvase RusA-like endonuclease
MPDLIMRMTVPGDPIPKGRPRFTRSGHAYTPARTRNAEKAIAVLALQAMRKHGSKQPSCGPVALSISFYVRRDADIDNLVKLVSDALNRIAYNDDRQVMALQAARYSKASVPRTEIAVFRMAK